MVFGTLTAATSKLLLAICATEMVVGVISWQWLAEKPRVNENRLSPQARSKHTLYLLGLLFLLVIAVTIGGILSHFDRSFYIDDHPHNSGGMLSPAHYYIFTICYPAYFFTGVTMYTLVKKWIPSLLPKLKWPILIAAGIPFLFIPAIDGNLLDQNITVPAAIYVAFYWIINIVWLGAGLAPIGFQTLKRFMAELSL